MSVILHTSLFRARRLLRQSAIARLPSLCSSLPFAFQSQTLLLCLLCLLSTGGTSPASDQEQSEILFARRIAPLLRDKCIACHGADAEDIQGGLDLSSSASAARGGDNEVPVIVAGDASASPLFAAAARSEQTWSAMPPKEAEKLTPEQLGWLKQWIDTGAAWPDPSRLQAISAEHADEWSAEDGVPVSTSGGLSLDWTNRRYAPAGLWAYQPVKPPVLSSEAAAMHPIDALLAQRRPAGLQPAGPAERLPLLRRATYDLTGLPPSIDEVQAFLQDERDTPAAFADVVDRLLDSPHYGERMGQHWLDVVRYADSSGFANDFERGNAWRYRDYVIRAFNADKPYDDFIREQIAGDELDEQDPEKLIATGFLRMGPWELTSMEVAKVARQRFLDDVTNSVGETFLGHSLQCARCHDHKFDPVPTQDYYSIQAVFATTQLAERTAPFLQHENRQGFSERDYLRRREADYQATLTRLDEVLLNNAQQWYRERDLSPAVWDQEVARLRAKHPDSSLFGLARKAMQKRGLAESDYPPKLVGFKPQQFGLERIARKGLMRLKWEYDRYRPYALAVYNGLTDLPTSVTAPLRVPTQSTQRMANMEPTCILTGGDPFSPAQPVTPGALSVLQEQLTARIPESLNGRRLGLANWIADKRNPLTTRVIVNRLWLWHFGQALAGNPNNFGSTGKRPTHPELLDWLAATLVENDWSLKAMHRIIMRSDAYQRSSQFEDKEQWQQLDPLGEYYAVFKPRRLSAEELRDSMLAVTGELNRDLGGIPCRPEINSEVALQPRMVMGTFANAWTPNPLPKDRHRRSIYVLRLRGLTSPLLEVFNAPAPDFSCEMRTNSTITPQVFALFNGQNTYARALSLALSVGRESASDQEVVQQLFVRLFGRHPTATELRACVEHWRAVETMLPETMEAYALPPKVVTREAVEENTGERFSFDEQLYSNADFVPDHEGKEMTPEIRALADLCLTLLNSNEFAYID